MYLEYSKLNDRLGDIDRGLYQTQTLYKFVKEGYINYGGPEVHFSSF